MRLLVIEDNSDHADLVRQALQTHEITRVSSLADALAFDRLDDFDGIICDLALPDAYGPEAVRKLSQRLDDTPILVLTTDEDEASATAVLEAGAQDFLPKIDVLLHESLTRLTIEQSLRYSIVRQRRLARLLAMQNEEHRSASPVGAPG